MKNKQYKLNINYWDRGQTILETMIAIGILGMTLAGVIILLVNISNYGVSSEARSLAVNYAQEAMDVIKTIRDNEYCSFFNSSGDYEIYKDGDKWKMQSSAAQWVDIFPEGSREKRATKMQRGINIGDITGIPAGDGRKVTVDIRWQFKGLPEDTYQTYTTTTEVYKWKY